MTGVTEEVFVRSVALASSSTLHPQKVIFSAFEVDKHLKRPLCPVREGIQALNGEANSPFLLIFIKSTVIQSLKSLNIWPNKNT